MFITVCYVYLWVRFHKCYSALIRNRLSGANGSSLSFRIRSAAASAPAPPTGRYEAARRQQQRPGPPEPDPEEDNNLFLQLGDKSVCVTELQVCDDLGKWTVLAESSVISCPRVANISFIIEAAEHTFDDHASHTANKKVLKWSDYCCPLACSPGRPFRALAQATIENFSRLGVAFIEDRLRLDTGLAPSKIIPVLLKDSTLDRLLKKQHSHSPMTVTSSPCSAPAEKGQHLANHQQTPSRLTSLLLTPKARRRLEERRGSEPTRNASDLVPVCDSEDRSLGNNHHMEGHGHHLHLSSCNECLELENSTILSVKFASAENIPDLPDDNSAQPDSGDEIMDEPDKAAEESSGREAGIVHCNKLPNVLVYTSGCQERFETVRQALTDCLNMENYTVYPLLPQQALSDPWLDTTRLLVLAEEEPLTPQLQTRFLNYLGQGGRVLGLASSLCPAGLSLEVKEDLCGQVRRLSFTREDSTELELSALASGKVFLRDVQGGGEVELWGELKGEAPHPREMVIVRVTHGEDGGEAVICQVHLEIAPDDPSLTKEGFDKLKMSNSLRCEVLTEILTSLGLSCQPSQAPAPSPIHLLATSQDVKETVLKLLQTRANQNGLIAFPKVSFRLASCSEHQNGPVLADGPVGLVTDSPESQTWQHFSLETYKKNLKTKLLGRTVLYAEVVSSTMDVLDGLNLHLPKDVGLIAIASQQSKGKGRGRNTWLSPLGCAMFTLSVQVELSSKLGQRIPFLQHLAALSVIEAVRTLPGYQDIDLRVKWPNDIYYSNLMKLGGVLVTSTVMGSIFHLLIGCGVNIANSNPTVCVNDLIRQHNRLHGCDLQPLSSAQLIARTVNCLEALIATFQQGGPKAVLPTYYDRWVHGGTRVHLWSEDGPEAEVVGLDDNGFLHVRTKEQGMVSLEPDGNSFDMLKNLVVMKKH